MCIKVKQYAVIIVTILFVMFTSNSVLATNATYGNVSNESKQETVLSAEVLSEEVAGENNSILIVIPYILGIIIIAVDFIMISNQKRTRK